MTLRVATTLSFILLTGYLAETGRISWDLGFPAILVALAVAIFLSRIKTVKLGDAEIELFEKQATEISKAQIEAIKRTASTGINGAINPIWGVNALFEHSDLQKVEFDVAVTISEKTNNAMEAGIKVLPFKLGGENSKAGETSNVSRVRFSIPIIPPTTIVNE